MKGKVLDFTDGTGIIAAKSGERFTFGIDEWKSSSIQPQPGILVDYQLADDVAVGVYVDQDVSKIQKAGFYRSKNNKMVGGVCAGLADKWKMSITGMRFVVAAGALFFWIPAILYFIAWLVFPAKEINTAELV